MILMLIIKYLKENKMVIMKHIFEFYFKLSIILLKFIMIDLIEIVTVIVTATVKINYLLCNCI